MKKAVTFLITLFVSIIFYTSCTIKKPQYIATLAITDSAATTAQIDTAVSVLTKRLQLHGFKNAQVAAQNKQIIIQSTQQDKEWIINNLLKKGILTFYECYSVMDLAGPLQQADKMLAAKVKTTLNQTTANPLFDALNIATPYNDGKVPGYIGIAQKEKIPIIKDYIAATAAAFPADVELLFAKEEENAKKQQFYSVYFLKNNTRKLNASNHILEAIANYDYNGRPSITMQLDPYTSQYWQRMTAANINKTIAIVIDGTLVSAPNVTSAIEGGKTEISGVFTAEETKNYATLFSSGYLPVTLVLKNIKAAADK
jgi:preprotein translocase subunit SecD